MKPTIVSLIQYPHNRHREGHLHFAITLLVLAVAEVGADTRCSRLQKSNESRSHTTQGVLSAPVKSRERAWGIPNNTCGPKTNSEMARVVLDNVPD